MQNIKYLSTEDILKLSEQVANQILDDYLGVDKEILMYGIPRGGVPSVYAVKIFLPQEFKITDNSYSTDIFIDDIIDSGNTRNRYLALNPNAKFYALIDKEKNPENDSWVIYPWEVDNNASIEDAFIRLKQYYNIPEDDFNFFKTDLDNYISNHQTL